MDPGSVNANTYIKNQVQRLLNPPEGVNPYVHQGKTANL